MAMMLPLFIIGLLALICVLLVVFLVRLDREVYQLKAEVGLLKLEVAGLGANPLPGARAS